MENHGNMPPHSSHSWYLKHELQTKCATLCQLHTLVTTVFQQLQDLISSSDNQMLTPSEPFMWTTTSINGIKTFYVTDEEIMLHSTNHKLEDRYASAKKVPGIRSHHCFHPTIPSNFRMFCISSDSSDTAFSDISLTANVEDEQNNYLHRIYVACVYDDDWFPGNIVEKSEENQDVLVNFMTKNPFKWP